MKKTITLSKAVDLKNELERAIKTDNESIKKLITKTSDLTSVELDDLEDKKREKSILVIYLNNQIQEINLKIGKGEKICNTDHIKTLSLIKQDREMISSLNIDSITKVKKVKELDREISNLQDKLSKFNNSQKLKIEISEELLNSLSIVL